MSLAVFGEQPSANPGEIVLWAGALSNIPSGWVICDGNNGTPNLLNRFVKEVPDGSTNPGSTGGQSSYSLSSSQLPSHDHDGKTGTSGSHTHTVTNEFGEVAYDAWDSGVAGGGSLYETTSDGSHSHSIDSGPDSTGSGNSIDNRPAYYEVAYIMKV